MGTATKKEMNVNDRQIDSSDDPLADVKSRFGAGYEVNAGLVAEEIIRKLRLVKWARHELLSEPGRTPGPSVRDA
jgi:hypothetical protein